MTLTIAVRTAPKQAGMRPAATRCGRVHAAALGAVVALLGMGAGAHGGTAAAEPGVTAWSAGAHAAARLIAAGPAADGAGSAAALAGVEIRLDPGFLTYWRDPGEAGLPPRFDMSGSDNVASVSVGYPAPRRLDEGGALAYGYTDAVIFPLTVVPVDPARPVTLAVDLDYAVCGTLCLPAAAHLRLLVPDRPVPDQVVRLQAALREVPRPAAPGGPGPLAVVSVVPSPSPGDPGLNVRTRGGPDATLFVEPPEGWFLRPGQGAPDGGDGRRFHVAVLQKPDGATLDGLDLRLTLVDSSGSIDVRDRVKAVLAKPPP